MNRLTRSKTTTTEIVLGSDCPHHSATFVDAHLGSVESTLDTREVFWCGGCKSNVLRDPRGQWRVVAGINGYDAPATSSVDPSTVGISVRLGQSLETLKDAKSAMNAIAKKNASYTAAFVAGQLSAAESILAAVRPFVDDVIRKA